MDIIQARVKWEWVRLRERNEALDTHVYTGAAASSVGYDEVEV